MPSELSNQLGRGSGAGKSGGHGAGFGEDLPSRLVVITFETEAEAVSLYEKLKELDKKGLANLEDAVFVHKNEDGTYKIDEKTHAEKRSGILKGGTFGVLIGLMLGGPVVGLAGGAIVGRMIGKRMDLGIDKGTIKSISEQLDNGSTALFISGSAKQTASVIGAFKGARGNIIETTVLPEVHARLQKALDSEA